MGANGEAREKSDQTDLETRLKEVEDLTRSMGQLTVIHDVRLRELGTMFRTIILKKDSPYNKRAAVVDAEWKELMQEYNKRRRDTGKTEEIGSKHLRLAANIFEEMYKDPQTSKDLKDKLQTHWQTCNKDSPDFLGPDVRVMKWRQTKDGKHGVLEFKLADTLSAVEEELIRVMVLSGGELKTGPAARGERVRDLERKLEGTWGKREGTGARSSAMEG